MDVNAIAASGLRAAGTDLRTAATNIANATTPGFKAEEVVRTAAPQGGVVTDVVETEQDVSTDQELVRADMATYNFQANLKVLERQRDLDKSLLDIQA